MATLWNILFNYGALGLTIVRNLVLVPVYLRYLDLELYGAWLATGAALAQMIVSEFGFLGVVIQRTGSAFGAGDYRRLGAVIGTSRVVVGLLALVLTAIGAALSPFIPDLMHLEGDAAVMLMNCFLIVVVGNAIDLVGIASGEMLKSLHRPLVPGLARISGELLSIVVTLALLLSGYGLYSLAAGLLARSMLFASCTTIGQSYDCRRHLKLKVAWTRTMLKSLWRDSFHQFFTALAMRLQVYIDPFLVGVVLGGEAAAIYGLTYRALDTVRFAVDQIGNALVPSLAHLFGSGDKAKFREVFETSMVFFVLISTVGMGGILVFNRDFVSLWVGPDLFGGNWLNAALAVFGFLGIVANAPYFYTSVRGEFRKIARVLWLSVSLHLPLSYLLIHFGLWGAPVAASLGILVRIILLGAFTLNYFEYTSTDMVELGTKLVRIFAPGAIITVAAYSLLPPLKGWELFALGVVAYLVASVSVFVIFNRKAFVLFRNDLIKTFTGERPAG